MRFKAWMERQAPDFLQTWQRFPLAIVMAALTTAIVIGAINEVELLQHEEWARAALGLATGAVFAVAGVYFAESRPEARPLGLLLKYALPVAAVALLQITDTVWFVPFALPIIAILWLSVSPFTTIGQGVARDEQQNRFWIVNHQALATAAIAAGAFAIIAIGLLIIERSLSVLFGFDSADLFYRWLLPITGLFLSPVYWLSTLPRVSEVQASEAERPEFVGKAVGFLGQFVLVPMLLLYALILLAYTAQIVMTQSLPEGMIGWMVMGFVIVGAATWLVLYPPFMRGKPLVRLFRQLWFWLTLVPLALFFFAVWVRVDTYGFTSERLLLLGGGLWALALAGLFLARRGDIRIIPALAAAVLLLLSIGPWNYVNLPVQQHLGRLDALVMNAGADKSATPPRSDWSAAEAVEARGIIDYLVETREGRDGVRQVLGRYGVTWAADSNGSYAALTALGVDPYQGLDSRAPRNRSIWRELETTPVPVADTPFYLRGTAIYVDAFTPVGPISIGIRSDKLVIRSSAVYSTDPSALATNEVEIDLAPVLAREQGATLVQPWIDFAYGGVSYRFALESLNLEYGVGGDGPPTVYNLAGELFADRWPMPTP